MYLIFDTETTGLPRDYSAPITQLDNWPRLVQLAWQLHDHMGALQSSGNYIIRPEGWHYIARENIPIPKLYFAHTRKVFNRRGVWLADTEFVNRMDKEELFTKMVRFRTIGDATCTGAVLSSATTIDEIIQEVTSACKTERGNRQDDKRSETSMEDRKEQGYF